MINLGEATYKNKVFDGPKPCALCFDGVNDVLDYTIANPSYPAVDISSGLGWTYSMWIRMDAAVKQNTNFLFESAAPRLAVGRTLRVVYNATYNRLIVRFEEFANGDMAQRQYPLHDNSSVTGITDSNVGWVAGVGDVYGYVHLTVAVNILETQAANMIKVYWNGQELTNSVNDASDNFGAGAGYNANTRNVEYLVLGDSGHTGTVPQAPLYGCFDDIYVYPWQLSAAEANTIYTSTRLSPPALTGWTTAFLFDNNDYTDTNGYWTAIATGTTFHCSQNPMP